MLDLTRTGEPAEWLGTRVEAPVLASAPGSLPSWSADDQRRMPTVRRTSVVRHLAALDALQPTAQLLRLGWVTVAGTVAFGGKDRTVCFPLVSQPTRIVGEGFQQGLVVLHGPAELTLWSATRTLPPGWRRTPSTAAGRSSRSSAGNRRPS